MWWNFGRFNPFFDRDDFRFRRFDRDDFRFRRFDRDDFRFFNPFFFGRHRFW